MIRLSKCSIKNLHMRLFFLTPSLIGSINHELFLLTNQWVVLMGIIHNSTVFCHNPDQEYKLFCDPPVQLLTYFESISTLAPKLCANSSLSGSGTGDSGRLPVLYMTGGTVMMHNI